MKWDPVKIKQGKIDKAKTEIKEAIKDAFNAGLYYEDMMQIVADVINDCADEARAVAEEAM